MTPRELRHRLRLQGMRLWILAALVVYSIVGFVLVPWVVRRQLVDFVQQDLGRRLALERVRFNPYTFALRVLGFDMEESDGTPLLAFGELLVDFEPGASLVQRAWDFGEITLRAPRINYVRFTSGDDNFGRLVSDLQKPAEEEEAAPAEPTGVPRVVIAKIAVEDAAIDVADRSRRTPFTTHLGPGGFVVHDLTTLPEHEGRHTLELTTESGARLGWDGTFAANPVRSSGHVSARGERLRLLWRYLQDQVRFEVVEGSAVLELDYTMSATAEGLGAEVSNLTYDLRDLLVRPKGEPTDVLAVREIVVRGGHLSWPARRAGLAEVRIAGTRLALWREPDGTINLSNLITSDEADEGAGKADAGSEPRPDAPPTAGESPSPWELTLDRLLFEDCNISVEDRTFPDPVRTGLDGLRLEARKLSSVPGSRFDFSLETTVTTGGRLGCEGSVGLDPPVTDARVVLRDLALPPAQPYLAQVARLVLESGALSLESRLSTTSEEQLRFDGKVSVSGLTTKDTIEGERFVAWRDLVLNDVAAAVTARTLTVAKVDLDAPYARFVIARDGSTNVGDVLVPAAPTAAEAAPAAPAPAPAAEPVPAAAPAAASPFEVSIGRIAVREGSANFADLSLPLPFATAIHSLVGSVAPIGSAGKKPASVDIKGTVDESGSVTIGGTIDPFAPDRHTKVDLRFRNVSIPKLTPYTAKFAGHAIADGKLDLDLEYQIVERRLEADNRIVIDRLTLGEKIESPDSMNVPLGLAIALLKDRAGRIDLDLPVSGNLDDPEFHYGRLVIKVLKTLLVKVVTAPFTVLASLVGAEGGNLEYVAFAPGGTEIAPPEREKLGRLSAALAERPQLMLEVHAGYDPRVDVEALKRQKVEALLAEELGIVSTDDGTVEAISSEDRREGLEALYRERLSETELDNLEAAHERPEGEASERFDEEGYLAALQHQLADSIQVEKGEIEALGTGRARVIVQQLVAAGGLAETRVRIVGPEATSDQAENEVRVKFSLGG